MKQLTLPSIIAWLKAHQPLLLTTHVVPDGDGLGSEAGLYYFLRSKGLDVQIFNEHAVHAKFSLLDADDDFQSIAQKSKLSVRPRGVVVVDTHDWSRIGRVGPMLTEAGGTFDVLYLDHHVLDSAHASDKKSSAYMREEACATGELVYDVIEHWQKADGESMADVSKAAMLGVYVALVTDTGAFQFRRTTPRTHEMAAACIRQGVQPYEVQQSLFGSGTYQKLLFEAEALSQTKISSCGRIAYLALPLKLQEKYAMAVEDTQGLVGRLRAVGSVEVYVLAREEEGGVKFSLRSRGNYEVVGIAKHYDGGGHRHAAGMRVSGSLKKALEAVLKTIVTDLDRAQRHLA